MSKRSRRITKSRMFLSLSGILRKARGNRSHSSRMALNTLRSNVPKLIDIDAVPLYTPPVDSEWSGATIVKSVGNSVGLHCIDIKVEPHIAAQYRRPGQYLKVQGDGRPLLLAVASPPDKRNVLSFLVKDTPYHKYLVDLPTESSIDLSTPLGKGFQIQDALAVHSEVHPVHHIILMACGSGLAPIAAVIESGCLQRNSLVGDSAMHPCAAAQVNSPISPSRSVTLYIGARTRAHLPYAERYPEWQKKGIRVVPVLSRTEGRYVQEALRAEALESPENTMALLCGMKGMTDAATEVLLAAGVPKNRILLNY